MEKSFSLTKKEIGDAIVQYIGKYKEAQHFYPYRIKRKIGNFEADNSITFVLEFVPKGSTVADSQHGI